MTRPELLLAELHAYDPADEAEERHRRAMIALLGSGAAAFSRAHFEPGHFTASCFIVDSAGRLLLHHHRRLGRWLQMGGHVEASELPHVAALREGAEESGLPDLELVPHAIFDVDVHAIPAARRVGRSQWATGGSTGSPADRSLRTADGYEPEHAHFDVRYVAHTASPEAISIDRTESDELAWVTLDRAAELMPDRESHRVIRKLRERSLH